MAVGDTLLRYWPILVVASGLVASGSVSQFQISANAEEIDDLSESVDENEDAIDLIQRQLIQRQGQVEIRTQRIEIEQQQQGETLDEILRLLQREDN